MLKFVVRQPGQPDREVLVHGDVATIGRVPPCDVIIDKPFVSKQHVRVFHGLVALDLGSSNGTWVEGRKLTEAVLLEHRALVVGPNGVELRVEIPGADGERAPANEVEFENLRSRQVLLETENSELKRELAKLRASDGKEALIGRLKGENESLRKRVESLKAQFEERESDDGGSVQAKLAMQRVESVQELNEKLQTEVEELRAELRARGERSPESGETETDAAPVAAPSSADDASAELRAELARVQDELARAKTAARAQEDQTALVRKLRKELETVRSAHAASEPGPDAARELDEARGELRSLRARVGELEGQLAEAAPPPQQNVSDLFFKLQAENAEMRRKLAALDKGSPAPAAGAPRESKHVKELMEARLKIAALEAELGKSKGGRMSASSSGSAQPSRGLESTSVAPRAPQSSAAAATDVARVLRTVVDQDVEALGRSSSAAVDVFVLIESVRFLRQVERVVTRVAGDLIQLFQLQTMLPDTAGCYRELLGAVLAQPDDANARANLGDYLEKLGRWLVASLGAHRKAAAQFALALKDELTEASLTAKDPLPPYAKVPMLAGGELWKRAQAHLQSLSPDTLDERIETLARAQAQRLLSESA